MLVITAIITYTLKAVQFLNFGKVTQLNISRKAEQIRKYVVM